MVKRNVAGRLVAAVPAAGAGMTRVPSAVAQLPQGDAATIAPDTTHPAPRFPRLTST